jgi:hypothetical protein
VAQKIPKPKLLNLFEDWNFISAEYDKFYGDCEVDVYNLHFEKFYVRVFQIGGNVESVLRNRSILIGDVKSSPEEKKHAHKFMTPEIEKYINDKIKENEVAKINNIFSKENVNTQVVENSERRKKIARMKKFRR